MVKWVSTLVVFAKDHGSNPGAGKKRTNPLFNHTLLSNSPVCDHFLTASFHGLSGAFKETDHFYIRLL
jgi:hypothetical protein